MRCLDVNISLAETTNPESNFAMMKQGENVTEIQEEILVFHEEGEVPCEEIENTIDEQSKLKDLEDVLPNDVIGFLKRPIHHADFEWLATNPDAVELIKEISLPGDWINKDMIYEKLSGFRYFKCNFKIRVQVNAQPFNAGYLLMTYIPLHQQNTVTPSNVTTFSGLTGYRRVMLDLSEDTSAELVVPFNNILSHVDLINDNGYFGVVKLYVYSPLTGSDNVDGTVWITADDVKVSLPTGLPIQKYTPVPDFYHHGVAQSGKPDTKKDSKLQTNPPKKGKISRLAEGVGTVANVLKDVPVIGSVASTVEWAADAVGGIAGFFGFSKPIDSKPAQKETLVVANNFANYDGDSKAKSLAFYSQNETEIPVEAFGTEQDEMSFSHILAQPVYLTRFKMAQTNKQGTVIWKWPVDPLACQKSLAIDPKKTPYIPGRYICQNTYLSYLSQFFKYYRGSIRYHIRIVKTAFHSGRIRVFVVPGATPKTDLTSIDFNKVHSVVYDIRDTTTFDIEVPYKWNTPWKAIDKPFYYQTTAPNNYTPNDPTAMIYIQVVNALRNPATTADKIDFVVETSAADDFQFAVPMVNEGVRLVPSEESLRADFPAEGSFLSSGVAQSGVQILDNAGGDQMVANKIAIGEVITGWRTLLKRYSRFLVPVKNGDRWYLEPYDSVGNRMKTNIMFDHFSACDLLYRFRGGSLRVAAKTNDKFGDRQVITHEVIPHDSYQAQPDTLGAIVQSTGLEPVVEITVPFYQETIAIPTSLGNPTRFAATDHNNYLGVPYNLGTEIRSTAEMEWWRSIGEDFAFGYLVGPPKTLMNFESKECNIKWRDVLAELVSPRIYDFAVGPANTDKWKAYGAIIIQQIEVAFNGDPDAEMQRVFNNILSESNLKEYLKFSDIPADSTKGQDFLAENFKTFGYSQLVSIFRRICFN